MLAGCATVLEAVDNLDTPEVDNLDTSEEEAVFNRFEEYNANNDSAHVATIEHDELVENVREYEGTYVYYDEVRINDVSGAAGGHQELILSLPASEFGDGAVFYGVWDGDPFSRGNTIELLGIVTGMRTYMSVTGTQTIPEIEIVGINRLASSELEGVVD